MTYYLYEFETWLNSNLSRKQNLPHWDKYLEKCRSEGECWYNHSRTSFEVSREEGIYRGGCIVESYIMEENSAPYQEVVRTWMNHLTLRQQQQQQASEERYRTSLTEDERRNQ